MRSRAHSASPQAISQLPAKIWGILGNVGILLEEIRLQRIVLCE